MFRLGVNIGKIHMKRTAIMSFSSKKQIQEKKAAVVLSGSGHLDGSCMHETSALVVHLSRLGLTPTFYAPKILQHDVINHLTTSPMNDSRCVLKESARIARGKIMPLCELRYCDVSCLFFPGGFGIAKTFTTFEEDKANCSIESDVMRVLEEFHDAKKPMGFLCIAGILPARMFPCVKVTLGMKDLEKPDVWPYQNVIDAATQMGAEVEPREVDKFSFDKQHMIFTTPAFLYNGTFYEIFDGIGNMVQNMVKYLD